MKTRRPLAAIVLAAGLGRRMRSAVPKVVHELGGRPLLSYPLRILSDLGADPVVVVVGYGADVVRRALAGSRVRFAVQARQRGTGDAALAGCRALRGFRGDVLVVNGDLPLLRASTFRSLIDNHRSQGAVVSLVTAEVEDGGGFGRVVRDASGRVVRIVEERDADAAQRAIREVNVGLYCADAAFLRAALRKLAPANAQGELYLTDVVEQAGDAGRSIATARASAREGLQVSSRADLASVEKMLRDEINARWMAEGVTLEDPATTYIGPDVRIGRDTVIGPNVILRGATRIGRNCRFDGTAMITDSVIGDGVHIRLGVVVTESLVEDDVQIGPFAQLRTETHLKRGVHIGDFVETKKAVLGAGVKANHLAYLGDTEIGEGTNIGAGTITCNYDGFAKYRTIIGKRVQVGSDTQLVAPVRVGDDAFIATGSTVRNDVAAGALFFNPRGEEQRPGWVVARRRRQAQAARRQAASAAAKAKKARTRKGRG